MNKELLENKTLGKIANGLKKIRKDKNFNLMYGNQLYLDLNSNIGNRADRFMHFIAHLLDKYDRCFKEYLITEKELKELVEISTNNNVKELVDVLIILTNTL